MKITKKQLKQIIKEELSNILAEGWFGKKSKKKTKPDNTSKKKNKAATSSLKKLEKYIKHAEEYEDLKEVIETRPGPLIQKAIDELTHLAKQEMSGGWSVPVGGVISQLYMALNMIERGTVRPDLKGSGQESEIDRNLGFADTQTMDALQRPSARTADI
jgi:hypothetical protein